MVKLRLKRIGRRKSPFYRLVAIDARKRRDGREIERLGWYNPLKPGFQAEVNEERVRYWLGEGAVPSATVHNLLTKKGINNGLVLSERKSSKRLSRGSFKNNYLGAEEKKELANNNDDDDTFTFYY